MSQRTVLAAVAGAITLFALGFLTYAILLADFYAANGRPNQAEPVVWAIMVGNLVLAILITYIFSQWASISTFAGGLRGGAVIGALLALGLGLIHFGALGTLTLTAVAADTVISLIRYGAAGGVVGMMLGRE